MNWDDRIKSISVKHGFDPDAAEFMARTIESAGGRLAHWDHPKLGGLGQWMPGITTLASDDKELEHRLDGLCLDLLALLHENGHPDKPGAGADIWWPKSLGLSPNSAGGQNQVRYAYFAAARRLAVDRGDGKVAVYDTGEHQIRGVSQAQSSSNPGRLVFQSQLGEVDLNALPVVEPPKA